MPVDTYGYEIGRRITHKTYGTGIIEELGKDKATIRFDDGEVRSFSLKVLVDNRLVNKV